MLNRKKILNQKGMATVEMIPMIIISILILNFTYGLFGVIHTGILNSMAARNYAFDTFSHRANLMYFRDNDENRTNFKKINARVHTVVSEKRGGNSNEFLATKRPLTFLDAYVALEQRGTEKEHNQDVLKVQASTRYTETEGVSAVWVRPAYGICLDSTCESQ